MPGTDFRRTKAMFHLPDGVTYLDGNSLGPLPVHAVARAQQVMTHEWGDQLIRAWNTAGWMDQPGRVGDKIARLIGAPAGSVVVGDTLSIKVYQALAAAIAMNPGRKVILSDNGNFPTDLYMAQGLIGTLNQGHILQTPDPDRVAEHLSPEVAVLMLTDVDYRTGRRHDMARLTAQAHDLGIITIWDLAHSAGALPVDVTATDTDFAVGCTYKYLNGGPGAPAFIYVAPRLTTSPALSGWMGHAAPFEFSPDYRPAAGVQRMRVGTPPVIAMSILDTALDIWAEVDIEDVRQQSIDLSEQFIAAVEAHCPALQLISPRDPVQRGSQVAFRFDHGYAAMQALIAEGVIGDFRAPDVMRFGITPLYIDAADIARAVSVLRRILDNRLWDRPEFHRREAVT